MEIKSILITSVAPMSNHIANAGEKILGNASSIKQRPDGRVYISGQKQRHALFAAIDRLNEGYNDTFVSNGDGVSNVIERDIRADLGGYLLTQKESYSGRRTAPLTATPAVALHPSNVGRDLLIRLRVDESKGAKDQALATREYSQCDEMVMSFHIDVGMVGNRKTHTYTKGHHLDSKFHRHISDGERHRRIKLAIEATNSLTDYANNARNATSAEPNRVLIVLDTKISRKLVRFFEDGTTDVEKERMIEEVQDRKGMVIFGDDRGDGDEKNLSVSKAYNTALEALVSTENKIYNPAEGNVITTEEFEQLNSA